MIPFEGFAPDVQPETPGIFTDCKNILPAIGTFVGAASRVDAGMGAISSAATGFAVVRKIDNSTRVFCGNETKLYEGTSTWTDVSKVGGYTNGPDDRWRFAQFGNVTLATTKSTTIQAISSGVSFANVSATAPKADVIETINNQIFVANIDGMGFGDAPERWACSAVGDETDWTPSVSTQCASGQLLDAPGRITALRRLGDVIVAYKERAMYVGQYVGAPVIWDFRKVVGDVGVQCQEAVVSTGQAHYFIGTDDFYVFDGTRPIPLQSPVRNWFFNEANPKLLYKICSAFDRFNQRIFWFFCSRASNSKLDRCIVFNIKTGKWGKNDQDIEYACEYVSNGLTYDNLGSIYSTYDSLPANISYNSPFWQVGATVVAVFGTDHKAYQLSGTTEESRIITGHYGDNIQFSTVSRIRPRFIQSPTSSTLNYSHSNTDASSFTNNISGITYSNNWYDFIWSARWHKFELVFNGPVAISGFDILQSPDGTE